MSGQPRSRQGPLTRAAAVSDDEWSGMFFISIIDFNLKTISHQIAGEIAAHMTDANDADPLN